MTEEDRGRDFDLGVADEHVGHPSQGVRPESEDDATAPGAEGATTIDAPADEPVGGGPRGDEFDSGNDAGPAFEED
jgi:hypothetical protein